MPTVETQPHPDIFQTTWTRPLSSNELRSSFFAIAEHLDTASGPVNILFDITGAGNVPLNAPSLALQSGFLRHENLGRVAVVGMDRMAQTLASLASNLAGKDILFFGNVADAMAYLAQS